MSSILLLVLGLVAITAAQSQTLQLQGSQPQISSDEMMVRATYAKAMMAYELEQISPTLSAPGPGSANTQHLHIAVSGVRLGKTSDILTTSFEELVTKPGGYALQADLVSAGIPGARARHPEFKTLSVSGWHVKPVLTENWAVPFSEALGLLEGNYTRYADFDVTITFMGRQRQYKAMFLFGTDSSGKPLVRVIDHIFGTSAINALLTTPVEQEVKHVQQNFGAKLAVKGLVRSAQPQTGCQADGASEFCCHAQTGHCGIHGLAPQSAAPPQRNSPPFLLAPQSASALTTGPATADTCQSNFCSVFNIKYDEEIPKSMRAQDGRDHTHTTGYHSGSGLARGKCVYEGDNIPCVPTCRVDFYMTPGSLFDSGDVRGFLIYKHDLSWGRDSPEGTNSCAGAIGYVAERCVRLVGCVFSVEVSVDADGKNAKVGVKGGPDEKEIWKKELTHTWTCPTPQ
jgi:hypothetical protein